MMRYRSHSNKLIFEAPNPLNCSTQGYSIVSCCIVLHCIVLYCIVLYCIALYCIVLTVISSSLIILFSGTNLCIHLHRVNIMLPTGEKAEK